MKRRRETIIRLVVKSVYQEEKCSSLIQILQQEMVRYGLRDTACLYSFYTKFNSLFKSFLGIDEGDEAISSYVREDDDSEDVQYRELDTERLAFEASEIDTNGITVATADRLKVNSVADNNKDITGINIIISLDINIFLIC